MEKNLDRSFDGSKLGNCIISVMAVLCGVTINTPFPYFKYIFLLLASIVIVHSFIGLVYSKTLINFFKNNWMVCLLPLFMIVLVTIKHILVLGQGVSPITGYGEILYIIFAIVACSLWRKEHLFLFLEAYVLTFTLVFIFTGHLTLYDVGYVCRTIGVYGNPNVLSLYAFASMFFSFLLFIYIKIKLRYIFLMTGSD